jgi:hypothetical protein
LETDNPLHLNKLESPPTKADFCLVWLKMAQWFWFDWLFRIFCHTKQFFSYKIMMVVHCYWWKKEPRYIIQCIWEETTDLPQVNWQTFSHSHISRSRIRTDVGWRWEVSWYETDVITTRPHGEVENVKVYR